MDELISWLRQNVPETDKTTVVHGDFRSVKIDSNSVINSVNLLCLLYSVVVPRNVGCQQRFFSRVSQCQSSERNMIYIIPG